MNPLITVKFIISMKKALSLSQNTILERLTGKKAGRLAIVPSGVNNTEIASQDVDIVINEINTAVIINAVLREGDIMNNAVTNRNIRR